MITGLSAMSHFLLPFTAKRGLMVPIFCLLFSSLGKLKNVAALVEFIRLLLLKNAFVFSVAGSCGRSTTEPADRIILLR